MFYSGKKLNKFVGPAQVFDGESDAFEAVMKGKIQKGSVIVIR